MAEKPNILIAVPAYGGNIKRECALSLTKLVSALLTRGISFEIAMPDLTDIAQVRNFLASHAHNAGTYSHVLFFDNDMIFEPTAVLKMLDAGKEVIACASPERTYSDALSFNTRGAMTGTGGIREVAGVGAGLMLISVSALSALVRSATLRRQEKHFYQLSGPLFGFFDRMTANDTNLLSEDHSFCVRWRRNGGGSIFAVIDESIGHVDRVVHRGRLIDRIEGAPK